MKALTDISKFLAIATTFFFLTNAAQANTHRVHHHSKRSAHVSVHARSSNHLAAYVTHNSSASTNHYRPVAYQVPTYYGSSLIRPAISVPGSGCVRPGYRHAGGDYLGQMGGESRWPDGKCIRVYVAPGKSTYPAIVANCFTQWTNACGHKFNWCFTHDPNSADYTIGWTTQTHTIATGDEAGITTTDTEVDPDTDQEFIDHARTRILTRYEGRSLSDGEVQKTVLHEIGHGLGLEGHSSNPRDIMYYAVSPKQTCRLSTRDSNTISRLYRS